MRDDGRRSPGVRFTIVIPENLRNRAKVKAAEERISMAEVCRRALARWVETGELPPKPSEVKQGKGRSGS
jgi:hypothetical protein